MRRFSYRLVAIASLIAASTSLSASPTTEAEAYLDYAITLLETRHINSAEADWPRLRAQAEAEIDDAKTTTDTYPAIRHLLAELGEKHSFLREAQPALPLTASVGDGEVLMPDLPTWRLVDGKFGLVQLPQLNMLAAGGQAAALAYTQILKTGLEEMDKASPCGWIVDLRENGGGNMWPMLQGVDPLLGPDPFGYFVLKGGGTTPWVRTPSGIFPSGVGMPEAKPSFGLSHVKAPVAVLLGPRTASSGEMTALAFIGRPNVRTFGMPTAGFTTANSPHRMSDGAFLVITESTVRDRTGKDYTGAIIPDDRVPLAEADAAAVQWLSGYC